MKDEELCHDASRVCMIQNDPEDKRLYIVAQLSVCFPRLVLDYPLFNLLSTHMREPWYSKTKR